MNTRMFYQTHGRKYVAVPEDYSLERSFTAVTPEGILRYYVFDGEQYRKTYYVLVRQVDGRYRVYYRDRRQFSGRKFTQSIANVYNVRPVKVISEEELPLLLEPYHIAQMKDADRWMLHYEPAADVTR